MHIQTKVMEHAKSRANLECLEMDIVMHIAIVLGEMLIPRPETVHPVHRCRRRTDILYTT